MKRIVCFLMLFTLILGSFSYAENIKVGEASSIESEIEIPTSKRLRVLEGKRPYEAGYDVYIIGDGRIAVTYHDTGLSEIIVDMNTIHSYKIINSDRPERPTEKVYEDTRFEINNEKGIQVSSNYKKIYFNGAYRNLCSDEGSMYESGVYGGQDNWFEFDMTTGELWTAFMFKTFPNNFSKVMYPWDLVVADNGDIAIQRVGYEREDNYCLFSQNHEFKGNIDSLDDFTAEKAIYYAAIGYGENINSPQISEHFKLFGIDRVKSIQMENKLHLDIDYNENVINGKTGTQPICLATYENGQIIKNTTDAVHSFTIRATNPQNDQSRGGILFGVESLPFSEEGFKGMGISINPTSKKLLVERFEVLSSHSIRIFDLPESSKPEEGVKVRASIYPIVDNILMNIYVDGEELVHGLNIGLIKDIPATTSFGLQTNAVDIELDNYSNYGTMTVPRK